MVSLAGPGNERFLWSLGIGPVTYGDGLEERLRAVIPMVWMRSSTSSAAATSNSP